MINNLIFVINGLFNIYFWLILVRCLCSFIPSIDWSKQPFAFLRESTDAYLELFRRIIPPVNGLDFSPIVAVIALQILNIVVIQVLWLFK